MYTVMDTKRVTNNEATTIKKQIHKNEETLNITFILISQFITTIHNETPHTTRSSRHFFKTFHASMFWVVD
jgi:hypothetical protein